MADTNKRSKSTRATKARSTGITIARFGKTAIEQLAALAALGAFAKPAALSAPVAGERFTKVSSAGALLPMSATEWEGVYDATTGLIWGRAVLPGEANWQDSLKKAAAATLCGAPARAPTIQERPSIVDYERADPALDTDFFKNDGFVWEWTSTPAKSPSGLAWFVSLGYGGSYRDGQSYLNFVRAVRAGQLFGIGS